MRATIWGCRGTLASPGPETVRYGGQTSCIVVDLTTDRCVILDAGTGIRPYGMSLAGVHPPTGRPADHAPARRPHRGPPVLRSVLGSRTSSSACGDRRPRRRGSEQRLAPFFAPPFFPVHLRNVPSPAAVPRGARRAVDDRLGDRLGRAGEAPGAGRRLPDRGGRPIARVPPRPRARPRHRPRERGGRVDLGPRDRAGAPTCSSTTGNTRSPSTTSASAGVTRARPTP